MQVLVAKQIEQGYDSIFHMKTCKGVSQKSHQVWTKDSIASDWGRNWYISGQLGRPRFESQPRSLDSVQP